jgi:hypothetical protein
MVLDDLLEAALLLLRIELLPEILVLEGSFSIHLMLLDVRLYEALV